MERQNLKDPSLLLSPHPSFKCGETIKPESDGYDSDEEVGRVEFSCTIPTPNCDSDPNKQVDVNTNETNKKTESTTTLRFRCRDQSVGFLLSNETSASDDQENLDSCHETMDPNFFDSGYTAAGRTGFQIWAGSRVMMETLLPWPCPASSGRLVNSLDANGRIEKYRRLVLNGAKILEFGSGVGVVGTSLAAVGAQVLMTDLPSLVDYSLKPNIIANATAAISTLCDRHNNGERKGSNDHQNNAIEDENIEKEQSILPSWLGIEAEPIHKGWTSAMALDWTKPVEEQLNPEQMHDIRVIISCDCVWLVSMLDGLLNSVSSVFETSKSGDIAFLMSFQRRDTKEGNQSPTFTTVERVLSSVEARGWKLKCLAWRPVLVKGEGDWKEEKEVYVFEIKP